MKKSILTIAFVSFALVATSFTTVEASNSLSTIESIAQDPPLGGQCAGCTAGKKTDVNPTETLLDTSSDKINSFAKDQQSVANIKKID